jgi:hypothetical protein
VRSATWLPILGLVILVAPAGAKTIQVHLVLAADNNLVAHNTVTGNDTFGIAVADFCVGKGIPPEVCATLGIEPSPDGTVTVYNTVTGNGLSPDPRLISPDFAVDLAWDGTGTDNCWAHNVAGTQFPSELPGC